MFNVKLYKKQQSIKYYGDNCMDDTMFLNNNTIIILKPLLFFLLYIFILNVSTNKLT